jgi:hypothetical protein
MVSLGCEIRDKDRSNLAKVELCSREREEEVLLLQRELAKEQKRAADLETALQAEKAASARSLQVLVDTQASRAKLQAKECLHEEALGQVQRQRAAAEKRAAMCEARAAEAAAAQQRAEAACLEAAGRVRAGAANQPCLEQTCHA